jgi:hypothetical protein
LGIEPGYYDVIFRAENEPSAIERASVTSGGWVLGTPGGRLLVCGLGYLKRWQPNHPRHQWVEIAPGWYEVGVLGATAATDDCDGLIELVLRPADARPAFTADLGRELELGS